MVTRDAFATPQPHGLHPGSSGAHVPLLSESENLQPARPVTQTGQPLGHSTPPPASDRINVPETTELFGSLLTCSISEGITYCSAFPEDAVFGAIINSFQFRWTISCIANPEYEPRDMLKIVMHALASSESNETPFLVVLILPIWDGTT